MLLHSNNLFLANAFTEIGALIASGMVGGSVAALCWWIYITLRTEDLQQGTEWRYDVSRVNELRKADVMYRLFQPIIQVFARLNRAAFSDQLPEIQRQIQAAGLSRSWTAEEYMGRAELIAVLISPAYLFACVRMFGVPGVVVAFGIAAATVWILRRRLAWQAEHRLVLIKRRMPFLLDLLTLLMEAGINFLTALEQSVREFEGHPVSEEFGRVLSDMQLGKTRTEAFRSMQRRLDDDEITSIIGAIVQGEDLGSPLAVIFRTQADVLRLKRTQRAERLAGEAGVNMLLPGILVMLATVLIILGPFAVNLLVSGLVF